MPPALAQHLVEGLAAAAGAAEAAVVDRLVACEARLGLGLGLGVRVGVGVGVGSGGRVSFLGRPEPSFCARA